MQPRQAVTQGAGLCGKRPPVTMHTIHPHSTTMSHDAPRLPSPDDPLRVRQWQLLADELNRLNAQLEYLKLMLKIDLKMRGPGA